MRLMRRALVIYLLTAVLLGCAVAAVQHDQARSSDLPQPGRNATWLDHGWVGIPQPQGAIAQLCGTLRLHAIGTIYVHVGPVDGAGRIAAGRDPAAAHFIQLFHAICPGVQALAWIGQLLPLWDGLVDLQSASVRDGLVATAAHFAALGFDGVQYDLEPVADGDPAFLDLLRRTRHALSTRRLAVATPALIPVSGLPPLPHLRLPLTPWSRQYYARVAAFVDEIDPQLYVTALRDPADYSRFVAEQTADLAHLLPASRIRPGIPAFTGRTSRFDDRAENLQAALTGIDRAFPAGQWPDALAGVAIYPYWDMTPTQWAIFDRWLASRPHG